MIGHNCEYILFMKNSKVTFGQWLTSYTLQYPSLNTQSCNRRPLCSTFIFENVRSPKKPAFSKKKNVYLNLICKLLVWKLKYFQKKFYFYFFDHDNIKKPSSKLLIIDPQLFFVSWPGCPKDPETEIPYHAGLGIQTGHSTVCSNFIQICQHQLQSHNLFCYFSTTLDFDIQLFHLFQNSQQIFFV